MEAHRERVAHIGYQGEVEKFGGVELVTQPAGIRSVVLLEYACDGAPLGSLVAEGVSAGLGDRDVVGGGGDRPFACPFTRGRDCSDDRDDGADQGHQQEEELRKKAHEVRMPPSLRGSAYARCGSRRVTP